MMRVVQHWALVGILESDIVLVTTPEIIIILVMTNLTVTRRGRDLWVKRRGHANDIVT